MNNFRRTMLLNDNGSGEYVDLGLPSGTLWAVLHLDARRPEDYGHYTYFRKREAYLSQKEWRVPTDSEFQELRDNCLITWCSTQRGEKGVLFIGPNGNLLPLVTDATMTLCEISGFVHPFGWRLKITVPVLEKFGWMKTKKQPTSLNLLTSRVAAEAYHQ